MVTLAIYPIHSILSHQELISADSQKLLDSLKAKTGFDFKITTDFAELQAAPLALILVQSGGSEGVFRKEIYPKFKGTVLSLDVWCLQLLGRQPRDSYLPQREEQESRDPPWR
jgi:hypothetical protein